MTVPKILGKAIAYTSIHNISKKRFKVMSINPFSSSFYTFYMNSVMDKMANRVFQRNDTNKNDAITKDEFNGTKDALNLMDTDSDGEIDITDVKDAFGLNPTSTFRSNILENMLLDGLSYMGKTDFHYYF